MARFGDPQHHPHMQAGIQAALRSPRTPKHLKPHLKNRLAAKPTLGPGMDLSDSYTDAQGPAVTGATQVGKISFNPFMAKKIPRGK